MVLLIADKQSFFHFVMDYVFSDCRIGMIVNDILSYQHLQFLAYPEHHATVFPIRGIAYNQEFFTQYVQIELICTVSFEIEIGIMYMFYEIQNTFTEQIRDILAINRFQFTYGGIFSSGRRYQFDITIHGITTSSDDVVIYNLLKKKVNGLMDF